MKNGKVNRNVLMPEMSLHSTFVQEGENPRFYLLSATDEQWLKHWNGQFKCQTASRNRIGHLNQYFNFWVCFVVQCTLRSHSMGEKIQGDVLRVIILVMSTVLKKDTELFKSFAFTWNCKDWHLHKQQFPLVKLTLSLHLFLHSARSNPLMQVPCSENTAWFCGLWPIPSYCLKAWFIMAKPVLTCCPEAWLAVVEGLKPGGQSIVYPFSKRSVHCLNTEVFAELFPGFLKNAKLELTTFGILI